MHALNLARLAVARDAMAARFGRDTAAVAPLAGPTALDIGCGGGHGLDIDYRVCATEDATGLFDAVLALETIEHAAGCWSQRR